MQLFRFTNFISLNIYLLSILIITTKSHAQTQKTESTQTSAAIIPESVLSSLTANGTASVLSNSIIGTTNKTGSIPLTTSSSTTPTEVLITGTRHATTSIPVVISTSIVIISGSGGGTGSNATARTSTTTTYSSTSPSTISEAPEPTNTQPCNQHVEFCTRRYSNITYIGAHNSPFVRQNNVASNQAFDVSVQLADGIRMLQGQTHVNGTTIHYCHTSCDLLDVGPAVDYFTKVANFLQQNPFEVVTLLIGNGDFSNVNLFKQPLEDSGLARMAYVPPKQVMNITDWPTLGEMIITGRRIVIFMDYKANQTEVDYIIDEFGGSMWETPFSPTDPNFPCVVQRPENQPNPSDYLYMANHNLNANISFAGMTIDIPNTVELNVTNGEQGFGSLGLQSENCAAMWGRPPNFLLVDYYNIPDNGSVFYVAAAANNVTYAGGCCGKVSAGTRSYEISRFESFVGLLLVSLSMVFLL